MHLLARRPDRSAPGYDCSANAAGECKLAHPVGTGPKSALAALVASSKVSDPTGGTRLARADFGLCHLRSNSEKWYENSSADRYGLLAISESGSGGGQSVTARFRQSSLMLGLQARYLWSTNLEDWNVGGREVGTLRVEFAEAVVDSGSGYEIVELTASVTRGETGCLFILLDIEVTD